MVNAEVIGPQTRDGLDARCDKLLDQLDRMTEERAADARRIVRTVVAAEREQAAAEGEQRHQRLRSPPRWIYAFTFILVLLAIYLTSRKVFLMTLA